MGVRLHFPLEDEPSVSLTLLSANSREVRGRASVTFEDDVISKVYVKWHPDGALGLKVGTLFRWINPDEIIDGTRDEIFVPIMQ